MDPDTADALAAWGDDERKFRKENPEVFGRKPVLTMKLFVVTVTARIPGTTERGATYSEIKAVLATDDQEAIALMRQHSPAGATFVIDGQPALGQAWVQIERPGLFPHIALPLLWNTENT